MREVNAIHEDFVAKTATLGKMLSEAKVRLEEKKMEEDKKNMQYRNLGKSGLKVSSICLGGLEYGGRVSEEESINIIHEAHELGVNFIDSAAVYPSSNKGASERAIGKAIKDARNEYVVGSKVYGTTGNGPNDSGLSRKHIMDSLEQTLRNLDSDYVDILYAHFPDPNVPLEETLRTFNDIVRQGKARYIGCSNYTAWQLVQAVGVSEYHGWEKYIVVQSPYNLLTRDIEIELLNYCNENGIGVTGYAPMASGLLSGHYDFNKVPTEGRMADPNYGAFNRAIYWDEANFKAVERFKEVAAKIGITMPQYATAFVISKVTSAIIGANTVARMKESVACCDIVLPQEAYDAADDVWGMFRVPRKFYAQDGNSRTSRGRWGWERGTVIADKSTADK